MSIRKLYRAGQTFTAEDMTTFVGEQIIPFADAAARDAYFSEAPGQAIWSYEGNPTDITGNDQGWNSIAANDANFRFTYHSIVYQIRSIRWYFGSRGDQRGGLRFASDADLPGELPPLTMFRIWPLSNPGYLQRWQFRVGEPFGPSARSNRMATGTSWDFRFGRDVMGQSW